MSEATETTTETIPAVKAPKKKPARKRAKPAPAEARPVKTNEFAGVTANKCCDACTADHCVISTVGVCKHPRKTGDAGCGPITLANRAKVMKIIKHQLIDMRD